MDCCKFENEVTRYIPSFAGFTEFTASIPKLYWNVKSAEQRMLALCKLLNKVICYADMLGDETNEIKTMLQDILDGKLDPMIEATIAEWFEENEPQIMEDIEALQAADDNFAAIIGEGFTSENTVADAIAATNANIGEGFTSENTVADAIAATNANIGEGFTSENTVADAIADVRKTLAVSVKDFGAIGDGVTDDTAAIQAAIDSLYDVYIPTSENERYKVTDTLVTGREGQTFYMDRYANTGIEFYTEYQTQPLFRVDHELVRFVDMHLRAHTQNYGIGIQAEADTYVDGIYTNNTDLTIMDSDIIWFFKGVVTNARGPHIADTAFTGEQVAIEIYWNEQDTTIGTPVSQQLYGNNYGMRGIRVEDSQFHSISSSCIHIMSGNPTGMIVDGNRYDVGTGYFLRVDSGATLKQCAITNNTIMYPNVQAIRTEGGILNTVIDGNTFLGFPPAQTAGQTFRQTAGILMHLFNVTNSTISNNSFAYCKEDAIRIEIAEGVTVIGNSFYEIGTESTSSNIRGIVFVNQSATHLAVIGNAGNFTNVEGSAIVHSRSVVPFSKCIIDNNAISSASVINSFTDSGNNTLQTVIP